MELDDAGDTGGDEDEYDDDDGDGDGDDDGDCGSSICIVSIVI